MDAPLKIGHGLTQITRIKIGMILPIPSFSSMVVRRGACNLLCNYLNKHFFCHQF
ncbi:MAG: hypothetical protein BMS9Abin02_0897 [Anaerolineae bacterium]|nr:MAG: hypothetical protein BMS9Abin02_0897 [Anaerolineae bacterium]